MIVVFKILDITLKFVYIYFFFHKL